MKIPNDFFIIYQPKYRVPCIFDLHSRGLFKTRPFVTKHFGFRVLGNPCGRVKLQCAWLVETRTTDKKSGRTWGFAVEERFLDLDRALEPVTGGLEKAFPDKETCRKTLKNLNEWRESYLPQESNSSTEDLERKIQASIVDHKSRLRSELVHKNHDWIMAGLPRTLQDFRTYLYPAVRDHLIQTYRELGGESDEARVIRLLALFLHIFDHGETDLFKMHDWGGFQSKDQVWECWSGFTGSEDESRQLYSTMDRVFRPLAKKIAA
ncbi:hypothetical protein [Desulfospira joergensenii]|uniref:hypothetical protein n=1 Tax=Desulfospira joergensenii TaxID=53329 RepID=UPI0003B315C0|nr:hypothetical protein [Desulfospira joergensenii]